MADVYSLLKESSGIEEKEISLYARGMSTRDIHYQLNDLDGVEVSAEMVSKIADKILPQIKEWPFGSLNTIHPFVFMDCIHYNCLHLLYIKKDKTSIDFVRQNIKNYFLTVS